MKIKLAVCALLIPSLVHAQGNRQIVLADTADNPEPLCLRFNNNMYAEVKKCSRNWGSMNWTYNYGDPSGGGQLEREDGGCLSNGDDPGSSSYEVIYENCNWNGPSYEQTFGFIPVGVDKVRIMHLGDGTCLEAQGTTLGSRVRFELCDASATRQVRSRISSLK